MTRTFRSLSFLALAVFVFAGCERQDTLVSPDLNAPTADLTADGAPSIDEQDLSGVDAAFRQSLTTAIASEEDTFASLEAAASRTRLTRITGPTVITEPGVYRVVNDFAAEGDGIVIQSDYVLLLLNNRTITGPGNKDGRGIVIDGAEHVFVRGGTLETFGIGLVLLNTHRSAVLNVKVQGGDEFANPPAGIPPQIGTMLINSSNNRIQRITANLVNLGIFVRGGGSYENRIQLNTLSAGANGLLGICYNPAPGEGDAGPREDIVKLNTIEGFNTGIQTSVGSEDNLFTLNRIWFRNSPYEDLNGSNIFVRNRTVQIPAPKLGA